MKRLLKLSQHHNTTHRPPPHDMRHRLHVVYGKLDCLSEHTVSVLLVLWYKTVHQWKQDTMFHSLSNVCSWGILGKGVTIEYHSCSHLSLNFITISQIVCASISLGTAIILLISTHHYLTWSWLYVCLLFYRYHWSRALALLDTTQGLLCRLC